MWVPPLLFIPAAAIGILFAVGSGNIGLPYLLAFAAAAVIGTLLVVPRGLVVTVAQQPLLFTIVTPIAAWLTASWADPSVGGAMETTPTKTRLITAAYPIVQYFPWMIGITIVCALIAGWRYLEITRVNAKTEKQTRREQARLQKADETATESAAAARRRVAESDARVRHGRGEGPARRPASEIIQAAEERRRRAAERARQAQQARRDAESRPPAAASADPRDGQSRPQRPARPVQRPVQSRDPRAEQRVMEQRAAAAGRPSARPAARGVARGVARNAPRDVSRDAPRDVPREAPRDIPRDAARRDDRRRIVRDFRGDDRHDDRRREDVRRDSRRREAERRAIERSEAAARRPVEEWPPRHERARHTSRDERRDPRGARRLRDDRDLGNRDGRGDRGRDPRDPRGRR